MPSKDELRHFSFHAPEAELADLRRRINATKWPEREQVLSRRFDEAVPRLLLAIHDDPGFPEPHRFLAARYAHMGRPHSAREFLARLRTISSPLIANATSLRHPGHRELFLSGLRLAARARRDP